MTWFDYALLAILLLATLLGVWSGLWWQIYRFISLIISYIIAVRFYEVGDRVCEKIFNEKVAKVAGCILVFVVVLGTTYLFGKFMKKVLGIKPGIFGRLFGGLLGFSKGVLICGVIAFCLLEYNSQIQNSPLTSAFARVGSYIACIVPDRLRTGFEAFVKDTSEKAKEAADDMSKLGEMVNKFKQHGDRGQGSGDGE